MRVWLFALILFGIGIPGRAGAESSPSPAPIPTNSPSPVQPPKLPVELHPYGGAQELLSKYGTTPCVVVGGEAVIAASYVSAKINGTLSISSSALPNVSEATSALVRRYPAAQAIIGVGPFTQVDIIPPTYTRVDTTEFPLLVSGILIGKPA